MMRGKRGRGFTLVECALAGVVVLVAIALLGLMAGRSRKMGQLGESMANLRRIGELTGAYGNDYQERFWTFTWRQDRVPGDADADLFAIASAGNDVTAAGAQATQMLRRRLGRPDLAPPDAWLPHPIFACMVLAEYAGGDMVAPWAVSPGDKCRVEWQRDPTGPMEGRLLACAVNDARYPSTARFYPFSSSFEVGSAFLSPDSGEGALIYGTMYRQVNVNNTMGGVLGDRRASEVRYPSQKAFAWDMYAWYFGNRVFFSLMVGARYPVLMADGSLSLRTRTEARYPNDWTSWNPRTSSAFTFQYGHEPWTPVEPSNPGGQLFVSLGGHQRFTRHGLRGRDFDGPTVWSP